MTTSWKSVNAQVEIEVIPVPGAETIYRETGRAKIDSRLYKIERVEQA